MNAHKKHAGFTLLEILVTIAIVAILTALAIPSFQQSIRKNQTNAAAEELISAWNLARAEGIKSAGKVTLTAASGCGVGKWQCGWDLEIGTDTDTDTDTDKDLLKSTGAFNNLDITSSATSSIEFNRFGRPSSLNNNFLITHKLSDADDYTTSTLVCVGAGGQIKKVPYTSGKPTC